MADGSETGGVTEATEPPVREPDDGMEEMPRVRLTRRQIVVFVVFIASAIGFLYFVLPKLTSAGETVNRIEQGDKWWIAVGVVLEVLSFGGYIVLFPRARVLTLVIIIIFFTVIELPTWVMLGIWFAEQAVFAAVGLTNPTGAGGGVAYFAHVGGFAFGALTIRLLATKRKQTATPVY